MMTFKIISYIVAAVYFAIMLRWDVKTDLKKDTDNINHTEEAIVRAFLLVPTFILLLWPKLYHTHVWSWNSLLSIGIIIGLIFSVWWELFDGLYNRGRGQKWRFNGTVDEHDSILDRFLYRIGDTKESILKWSLILAFLLKYIFT